VRALLAAVVLLVASCGLGVSEHLGDARSLTDGPMDAGSMEHPSDVTTSDDATTDGAGDLPSEGEPVDAMDDANRDAAESGMDAGSTGDASDVGSASDAGPDQAEDAPPDAHEADAPGDVGEPDVAQDVSEPDVATDEHEPDATNDGPEAGAAKDAREGGVEAGAVDADTPSSSCRSSQPFGTPVLVPVLNPGGNLWTAQLSPDERVAYLGINTGQLGIFISVRPNRFDPFGPPTPLSAVNDTSVTDSPSATANGLALFFESNRSGGYRVYKAERSFLGAEFSKPILLTDLGDVPSGGPFVTPDGRALYFHSLRESSMDLYRAADNGTGFDPPVRLEGVSTDGADEYHPVVTPDELTIFYQSSAGMLSASRESLDLPFGPPVTLTDLDTLKAGKALAPNWVSPDGCRLYYVQQDDAGTGRLYVAERLPLR
jgi:hypothetical protein